MAPFSGNFSNILTTTSRRLDVTVATVTEDVRKFLTTKASVLKKVHVTATAASSAQNVTDCNAPSPCAISYHHVKKWLIAKTGISFSDWLLITLGAVAVLFLLCFCCCCILSCCCSDNKKRRSTKSKDDKRSSFFGEIFGKADDDLKEVHSENGSDKKNGEHEKTQDLGSLEFKLDYDFAQSQLAVSVLQAKNLPPMDAGGTSDPFVKVALVPGKKTQHHRTKTQKKTLNPNFDQTFTFKVPFAEIPAKSLVFTVYDEDLLSKDDKMGQVVVNLGSVDLGQIVKEWRNLRPPPEHTLGEVWFSLRYREKNNKLTVLVVEAKNLKKMDVGLSSDPYVKVELYLGKKCVDSKKTAVIPRSLNPYYNKSFKFSLPPDMFQIAQLVVTVLDHDTLGSDEPIGTVILGTNVARRQERNDWIETSKLENSGKSVGGWYTLQPVDERKKGSAMNLLALASRFQSSSSIARK